MGDLSDDTQAITATEAMQRILKALRPLAPDERARVMLFAITKYAPDAFTNEHRGAPRTEPEGDAWTA
jgi:hypothetical protein